VNRPATEVETRRPEEPDVNSTSPVLWELGAENRPWLPDTFLFGLPRTSQAPHFPVAVPFSRRTLALVSGTVLVNRQSRRTLN